MSTMSLRYGWMTAALWTAQPAVAADQIVSIEEEPKHVLKFQKRHVRDFDVHLPGYQAPWHMHLQDAVFVNIAASETAQDVGEAPATRAPRGIGETCFIHYTRRSEAHQVTYSGSELAWSTPAGFMAWTAW
jgi:hypothetical protein